MKVLTGHVFEKLPELPEKSVHTVITSPPYWGLRSYLPADHPLKQFEIGQEATPTEYIEKMVQVFRLVRRVLRDDGTLWLNMGDSFCSTAPGTLSAPLTQQGILASVRDETALARVSKRPMTPDGLKPKDLVGMPWRLALALQADGWWLRCDCIWHKPNPMPSSVTDRPTINHEYVFLLAKSEHYFFDAEAIKEDSVSDHDSGNGFSGRQGGSGHLPMSGGSGNEKEWKMGSKRNKRSVWTVPTFAYKGKHYATFPPDLIRPCILAGTSEKGCCAACGAPYERIVENGQPDLEHQRLCGGDLNGEYHGKSTKDYANGKAQDASATKARILVGMVEKITVGWEKTCECETKEIVPCTVMDPFLGSGTTAMVALEYGRNAIGIDLDPRNMELIDQRTQQPGFALP